MTVKNSGFASGGKIPGYTWASPTYDGVINDIKEFGDKISEADKQFKKAQELLDNLNKQSIDKWKMNGPANSLVYWKENKWHGNNTYWQDVHANSHAYEASKNYVTSANTWTTTINYSEIDQKTIELLFGIKPKVKYVAGENCIF